jgi:hypothetical protein
MILNMERKLIEFPHAEFLPMVIAHGHVKHFHRFMRQSFQANRH